MFIFVDKKNTILYIYAQACIKAMVSSNMKCGVNIFRNILGKDEGKHYCEWLKSNYSKLFTKCGNGKMFRKDINKKNVYSYYHDGWTKLLVKHWDLKKKAKRLKRKNPNKTSNNPRKKQSYVYMYV